MLHRGAINTKAVLKWVEDHYKTPEKILVTGFSAGAYASAYWLPHIRESYPNSSVTQFGDSGISPITEDFAKVAFENWKAKKEAPVWVPGLDPDQVDWNKLQIAYIYEKLMSYYPGVQFGHYTTAFDSTQRGFYWLMYGKAEEWPVIVKNTLHTLAKSPKFRYFSSEGSEHGVLSFSRFYEVKSTDDFKFQDWFKSYIAGEMVKNHDCVNCVDEEKELWLEPRQKESTEEIEEAKLDF